MNIFKRGISTLLVICLTLALLPPEQVFADGTNLILGHGDRNESIINTYGVGNLSGGVAGQISINQVILRVYLSRDKKNLTTGMAGSADEIKEKYASTYPQIDSDNALFFVHPSHYKHMRTYGLGTTRELNIGEYIPSQHSMMTHADTKGQIIMANPSDTSYDFENAESNIPKNVFRDKVLADKSVTQLSDISKTWVNYLPTYDEACRIVRYLFHPDTVEASVGGTIQTDVRLRKFGTQTIKDGKDCNLLDYDVRHLTDAEKLFSSAGQLGVLTAIYVLLANEPKSEELANYYRSAIDDYINANNIQENPVSLVVDTCVLMVLDKPPEFSEQYCIVPCIDYIEYLCYTSPSMSVIDNPDVFSDKLKNNYPTYVGSTRNFVMAMIEESIKDNNPSYATDNTSSVIRLADEYGYYNDYVKHPFFHARKVPQFSQMYYANKKDGVGGWSSERYGFMDRLNLNSGAIKGFMLYLFPYIGINKPQINYKVMDNLTITDLDCDDSAMLKTPPTINLNLQGDAVLISILGAREAQDPSFKVEVVKEKSSIYCTGVTGGISLATGKIYQNRELRADLLAQIPDSFSGWEMTEYFTGNKDITIIDETKMNVPFPKTDMTQTFAFIYEINLTLKIDDNEYVYKWEDTVARGDNNIPLNYAQVQVSRKLTTIPTPEDIIIPKPSSTTTTDIMQPSENEDLSNKTQLIQGYEYTTESITFAEIKNNEPLKEEYEVLGGVPSTEELYFSVGGNEFQVSLVLQYWMNEHSRDRTYTIHFDGTKCEYNNEEVGKGDTWPGADPGGVNGKTKIPTASGPSSSDYTLNHNGDLEVSCTWTGDVPWTGDCRVGGGCPWPVEADIHTWDWSAYNTALGQANAWKDAIGATTITWTSASDKETREYTLQPTITSNQPLSDGSDGQMPSGGTWGFANAGSHGDSEDDPHGADSQGSAENGTGSSYTITVKATIKPHMICGPCCGHELPAIWDTWKQGLVYDYVKISQIRLYKLDQGLIETGSSTNDLKELTGLDKVFANVVTGNPTYFMNIAEMTEQHRNGLLWPTAQNPAQGYTPAGNLLKGLTKSDLSDKNKGILTMGLSQYEQRRVSQSSRDGRLRYTLADGESSETFTMAQQGNVNTPFSVTVDPNKVANPTQHDDVIYELGARSANCDGMATTNNFGKSSSNNVIPMETTGHVNEWADGILYTNIQNTTNYSSYWNLGSYGNSYQPKQQKDNDTAAIGGSYDTSGNFTESSVKYYEDYNHHVQRDGLTDKTGYSDKADNKDILTAEWKAFNKCRRTKVKVTVISDFLILQTSGGDQSIYYFEKTSEPTESQEHFQKVKITDEECMTNNPLSIFNAYRDCSGVANGSVKSEYSSAIDKNAWIVIGGYNGKYKDPKNKYKPYSLVKDCYLPFLSDTGAGAETTYNAMDKSGTYQYWGGSFIKTTLNEDPAKTITRPKRNATSQDTSFKIYQKDIQIIPTTPNALYTFCTASDSAVKVWYPQILGYYSVTHNVYIAGAGGPNQSGILYGNVQLGHPQIQTDADKEKYQKDWGTYHGTVRNAIYATDKVEDNYLKINSVVVFTPVSTEDAIILPQGDINIDGKAISRDQRVDGFKFPNMNDLVDSLKVCPLDPAMCEFRYLDCKFEKPTDLANFDFETVKQVDGKWVVTDSVRGIDYTLPAGFSIESGGRVGSGNYLVANGVRWSLPLGNLGLSNSKNNVVDVEMDLTVNSGAGNLMLLGFKNYGFIITPNSQIGTFAKKGLDSDGKYKITQQKSFNNMNSWNKVHLKISFGFNNIVDCKVTVNGIDANVKAVTEFRKEWQEVTEKNPNKPGETLTYRKLVDVNKTITDWTKDLPEKISSGDIGSNLNIGGWDSDNNYKANYYIDNLRITLAGGSHEHTSACYTSTVVHKTGQIHVHNDSCYAKEDIYTCDGKLNANYQLGCGKEEGLPKDIYTTSATFEYTGMEKTVILSPGKYKLEVWGAQGGENGNTGVGGLGGYASGEFTVNTNTTVKVNVGGKGSGSSSTTWWTNQGTGGYNGGGNPGRDTDSNDNDINEMGGGGGGYTTIKLNSEALVTGGGGGGRTYTNNPGGRATGGAGGGSYNSVGNAGVLADSGGVAIGGVYARDSETYKATGWSNTKYVKNSNIKESQRTGNGLARITNLSNGSIGVERNSVSYTYSYTGNIQSVTLEAGTYKIEAWGAEGGDYSSGATQGQSGSGGHGGYSYGEITLSTKTTLYIGVGSKGGMGTGGYNGGGSNTSSSRTGGGGASHVSLATGVLSNSTVNSANNLLIVAGGGGGSGHNGWGGGGGGGNNAGSNGNYVNGNYGKGGSSSSYAAIGQGEVGNGCSGGGGGGYYAARRGNVDCTNSGAGGGSGYINTSKLSNYGGTNGVNTGNGKVKITSVGHKHVGTPGLNYPNGCYTIPTEHKHNNIVKVLNCTIPEGGDGKVYNFSYTGNVQNVTLPTGRYKFEVWGASGATGRSGGNWRVNGGYSSGEIILYNSKQLYIYVGGGAANGGVSGGWNGGGSDNDTTAGGGGGATDIRLKSGNWNDSNSLLSRIIVAGGSGGGHEPSYGRGGVGGGFEGARPLNEGSNSSDYSSYAGYGGTQMNGGAGATDSSSCKAGGFGYGGQGDDGGGGGGGWYGGGGGYGGIGGAGGSGYVLTKNSYKPSGYAVSSEYYMTNSVLLDGNSAHSNPAGSYSHGYARITNLDHKHTDSCYTTTTSNCSHITEGSLICNGEPNTTTDLNTHQHTAACLTNKAVVEPTTYQYTGGVQTYNVPWTDIYTFELYGANANGRAGYVKADVQLRAGSLLYLYVGNSNGYNDKMTDVRLMSYIDNSMEDKAVQDANKELSKNTILLGAGPDKSKNIINKSMTGYPITNEQSSYRGSTDKGWIRITPKNTSNNGKTIYQQIIEGIISIEDAKKYLGDALFNKIMSDSEKVLHTWSGWSTANDKGMDAVNQCTLSYNSGNLVVKSTGTDPHFEVPVNNIPVQAITKIKVYMDKSPSNIGQIFLKDNTGTYNEANSIWSNTITPNASNQVLTFDVSKNKNLTGTIKSIRFDLADKVGTFTVKKIEVYGYGNKVNGTGEAEYKNTETVVSAAGTTWTYAYTNSVQNLDLYKGKYKFEVWGAQGGKSNHGIRGGNGGYSYGEFLSDKNQIAYIYVGGAGGSTTGGFNGGGNGSTVNNDSAAGGGASDIRIGGTALSNRLIVAGGGGASGCSNSIGGDGGGEIAGSAVDPNTGYGAGGPGTQISGGAGGSNSESGSLGKGGSTGTVQAWPGGAGGGGYYGGGAGGNTSGGGGAGGGGSGYVNKTKLSNASTSTSSHTGNGEIKITAITDIKKGTIVDTFTPLQINFTHPFIGKGSVITSNLDLIPDYVDGDYNPIWSCKFLEKNAHICVTKNGEPLCLTYTKLDCTEPHHRGEHYGGTNKICYSACGNDDNHKTTKEVVLEDGTTARRAEFLQLDLGFVVYFPNHGDFAGNNQLGLLQPSLDRQLGYTNNMDTTNWTREKRVKFPFDVIYEDYIYRANTWIDLYVPQEYFNFYLLVSNPEMSNAKVEFEAEAINCSTQKGNNVMPGVSYDALNKENYMKAVQYFKDNYLNELAKGLNSGYKVQYAKKDTNSTTGTLAFDAYGIQNFFTSKHNTLEEGQLNKQMKTTNGGVKDNFSNRSGSGADTAIDTHKIETRLHYMGDEGNTINARIKSKTTNDNKTYESNRKRDSNTYGALHGGYKFYSLDVIGRIGNFTIVDTEDFRFSNFFKTPIATKGTAAYLDPTNWLVEGLVLKVHDERQNLYIGDTYDIRGQKANANSLWLDTYGTESWMRGQMGADGKRDLNNPNLISQILTANVNNIEVLRKEELRFGYDAYTSIETVGSYEQGKVQVIPKYYALKLTNKPMNEIVDNVDIPDILRNAEKGDYIPLDIYIDKDGLYSPVNIFGNAQNGNSNVTKRVDMYDYTFNLDWTTESERRNYTLEEKATTLKVADALKQIIYSDEVYDAEGVLDLSKMTVDEVKEISVPTGRNNVLGTAQYILMDGTHRTFIGSSRSYGEFNRKLTTAYPGEEPYFGKTDKDIEGISGLGAIKDGGVKGDSYTVPEIDYQKAVQRWHGKLGLPSSSVFVPHGIEVNSDNIELVMNDEFAIICTAEIIAIGSVWSLHYSQPWFTNMVINGEAYSTSTHYPGHRIGDGTNNYECTDCLPPIIAVYASDNSSVGDVEIIGTH